MMATLFSFKYSKDRDLESTDEIGSAICKTMSHNPKLKKLSRGPQKKTIQKFIKCIVTLINGKRCTLTGANL